MPEGNNAYELSPTTFRPLTSRRVTGGTKVGLGEADDKSLVNEGDSLVVFTEDPRVIATVRNRLAKIHQRAAQLTRDMVAAELAQSEDVERRLTEIGRAIPGTGTQKLRETAVKDLALCDASLKTDLPAAYYQARRAQQALRIIARAHWDRAVPETDWPLADPFTAHVVTLPQHYRFIHEMTSATRSPNRLPEGNFEDLAAVLRAGWKHFEHHGENESPAATTDAPTQPAIKTGVDWSPKAAHSGHYGLRLWAAPEDPKTKLNGVIETPPLWVTTAPVHVEQGDLVQIQGWLHVGQPIACSVDGLVVIDSMSGEALALRVGVTEKWRQFTLYRAAARSGPMSVTFALSGLGEAWIDDVSIQVVERNRATQPQQAQNTRLPPARP